MTPTVRPADVDDVAAIGEVAEEAWWATYPGVLETDTIREALSTLYEESFLRQVIERRDDVLFLVAERTNGDVIGFVTAQQTWADEVEIHTLYVHPDHQEGGIGTALLDAVEDAARAVDADRLRCLVADGNDVGRAFAEARGFTRVDTVPTDVADETVTEAAFEKEL